MPRTQLLEEQQMAGGVLPGDSAPMPRTYRFCSPHILHFGDAASEYDAGMNDALLFDLGDRAQIEMVGPDAQRFLHNFCTNDITRLQSGQGCEAFVTNAKGRILAHILVFVGTDSVWIETAAHVEQTLLAHLDRYLITDDVRLYSRTEERGELYLSGPASCEALTALNILSAPLECLEQTVIRHEGVDVAIRRLDLLNHAGFLLSADRTALVELWRALTSHGVRPGGAQAFHAHRIESAFPLDGLDLNNQILAQEAARTHQAISFTKGCYLGQEPIARIDAIGHVNRELRGLAIDGLSWPEPGDTIAAADGHEIGSITSSAVVPGAGRSVALGYLRSNHTEPGARVLVRAGTQELVAMVFWH